MPKFVLIAIGGTGMRIAQSFVALTASGMLTDMCGTENYEVEIRPVDLDIVTGSDKVELEAMINDYNKALPLMEKHGGSWRPKGILPVRSFSANMNDKSTLDNTLHADTLPEADRMFYHALYNKEDRGMQLRRGCKGRPRIGSLIWAKEFMDDWQNPAGFWRSITDVPAGTEVRLMFAGSVFGGTGASGTPTLAQMFRQNCMTAQAGLQPFANNIGMTLMLPYFSFGQDTEVDCTLFMINSKLALKYYEKSSALDGINFIQLVGDESRQMQSKQSDGKWENVKLDSQRDREDENSGQNDPSLPAELAAAIGICRYFAGEEMPRIYVPEKFSNTAAIDALGSQAITPLTFDHFKAYGSSAMHPVRSVKDYILRLERTYLLLNVYYKTAAGMKFRWRPEALRRTWGKEKILSGPNKEGLYNEDDRGVNKPMQFFSGIYRWLEELDHHGMRSLLDIGEQTDSPGIEQIILMNALNGDTKFDLLGIPGHDIAAKMNSIELNSTPSRAFVTSLMECCVEN